MAWLQIVEVGRAGEPEVRRTGNVMDVWWNMFMAIAMTFLQKDRRTFLTLAESERTSYSRSKRLLKPGLQ